MENREFEHLVPWRLPKSYYGATWENWFVVMDRNRDSDIMTSHVFEGVFQELEKLDTEVEDGESSVQIVRENHFLCGWVEWIGIHGSNTQALERAESLMERVGNGWIPNEDEYYLKVMEESQNYWKWCSLRERINLCHEAHVTCFAARHDELPFIGNLEQVIANKVERG